MHRLIASVAAISLFSTRLASAQSGEFPIDPRVLGVPTDGRITCSRLYASGATPIDTSARAGVCWLGDTLALSRTRRLAVVLYDARRQPLHVDVVTRLSPDTATRVLVDFGQGADSGQVTLELGAEPPPGRSQGDSASLGTRQPYQVLRRPATIAELELTRQLARWIWATGRVAP